MASMRIVTATIFFWGQSNFGKNCSTSPLLGVFSIVSYDDQKAPEGLNYNAFGA
jgi:hypothetical protein